MRWFTLIILLLIGTSVSAQRRSWLGVVYGNLIYRKDLSGQLNTWDNYSFNRPMQFIGYEMDRIPFGARSKYNTENFSNVQIVQFIPSSFIVNDSVSGTLSGASFGITYGYDIFRKSDFFDLMFSGGINLGRMKLIQNNLDFLRNSTNTLHLKNRFISPKAQVMLKFSFKTVNISFCADYLYDISGSDWKEKLLARHKPASADVPAFNQTGLSFSVCLGLTVIPDNEPYIPDEDEEWED